MLLFVAVPIPKGGGNCREIGLLKVAWKVIEGLLDGRLKEGKLRDALDWAAQGGVESH